MGDQRLGKGGNSHEKLEHIQQNAAYSDMLLTNTTQYYINNSLILIIAILIQ